MFPLSLYGNLLSSSTRPWESHGKIYSVNILHVNQFIFINDNNKMRQNTVVVTQK